MKAKKVKSQLSRAFAVLFTSSLYQHTAVHDLSQRQLSHVSPTSAKLGYSRNSLSVIVQQPCPRALTGISKADFGVLMQHVVHVAAVDAGYVATEEQLAVLQ